MWQTLLCSAKSRVESRQTLTRALVSFSQRFLSTAMSEISDIYCIFFWQFIGRFPLRNSKQRLILGVAGERLAMAPIFFLLRQLSGREI